MLRETIFANLYQNFSEFKPKFSEFKLKFSKFKTKFSKFESLNFVSYKLPFKTMVTMSAETIG